MTVEKLLLLILGCSLPVIGGAFYFWHRYWYIPRWARRKVERLRREEAEGVPPSPRDYHYEIIFDSDGFTYKNLRTPQEATERMRWADVIRVVVFKRDLFSVDCICLFLFRSNEKGFEFSEDMAKWNGFIDALPRYLPGCKAWSEWFQVVAFPAFATNETEIYNRESTSST